MADVGERGVLEGIMGPGIPVGWIPADSDSRGSTEGQRPPRQRAPQGWIQDSL